MDPLPDCDLLWSELSPLINKLIRRYAIDAGLEANLQGEIYFRFHALVDGYDPACGVPLRTYLVRQLSASIFTYARHQWRDDDKTDDWNLFQRYGPFKEAANPMRDWDDHVVLRDLSAMLPGDLAKLTQRQRQVLAWRYDDEMSYVDIAERLGIRSSTARSLLRHGLRRLRSLCVGSQDEAETLPDHEDDLDKTSQ